MAEIDDNLASRVRDMGRSAAAAGDPATSCPYEVAGSPREAALARIWVSGYLSAKPPTAVDYDDSPEVS